MSQEILGSNTSLEYVLDFWQSQIQTAVPAFVLNYNPVNQTATVKPVHAEYHLNDDGTKTKVEYPAIPNVQVLYPRGGGFSMHWPLKKNDLVLLISCSRSLDDYFETDGKTEVIPDDFRMHDPSDFVAFPGISTNRNKIEDFANGDLNTTDLVIQHNDGNTAARFNKNGTVSITASTKINLGNETANKALALAETVNANFTAFKTAHNNHSHLDSLAAPTSAPVASLGDPSDTSSAKVFTDS